MAVDVLTELLTGADDPEETMLVRDMASLDPAEILRERLRHALNQASVQIRRESMDKPELHGMGTTVVLLVIEGSAAHVAHVGDSRAYLYRDGGVRRLTRDHTVVQDEIDAGRLTPELARLTPFRNILTQSVGFHGPVEPDVRTLDVQAGDLFVLCSDGLTDVMDDHQLAENIAGIPADELADHLTDVALARGAEDNVTVLVVRVA